MSGNRFTRVFGTASDAAASPRAHAGVANWLFVRLLLIGAVGYVLALVLGVMLPAPIGFVGTVVVVLGALWLAVQQAFVAVDALVAARDDEADAPEGEPSDP